MRRKLRNQVALRWVHGFARGFMRDVDAELSRSLAWGIRALPCVVLACALLSVSLGGARPARAFEDSIAQTRRTQLANGLTILTLEDRSTPVVSFQLWVKAGSRDESRYTGIAHLFEHMMFKGSKNVEGEQHTSIVSSVGGRANAYTNEDTTVLWQTVPSHYLPLVLWMEGDRMATLRIEQDTFVRDVIARSTSDTRSACAGGTSKGTRRSTMPSRRTRCSHVSSMRG